MQHTPGVYTYEIAEGAQISDLILVGGGGGGGKEPGNAGQIVHLKGPIIHQGGSMTIRIGQGGRPGEDGGETSVTIGDQTFIARGGTGGSPVDPKSGEGGDGFFSHA